MASIARTVVPSVAAGLTPTDRNRTVTRHHPLPVLRCLASAEAHERGAKSQRRDVLQLAGGTLLMQAVASQLQLPEALAAACSDFTEGEGGLKFCETAVGDGNEPARGALIRCHYTGRLAANGRVFDSSYERGRPLTFKIGVHEVIQGWDMGILGAEGIPPMKEGGKRRLFIPSKLAYGERSVGGGLIPANSDLIFDVELLAPRSR
eukprot:CAMPEP_0117668610 /NCGR_PEP_ID=MMETSP0804-20121206/11651_1 /TAXON_ID=1074897 /ORGANISM="Tetraselmis astigmatica, Strain CCMP880" /LENGTH=205 /DNA_ID=CAMNT_0005476533 /DNA_START=50 /DNA_END=667 /DNA_ORIENTATION=+